MTPSNKRQADEEPKPARTAKRRAAAPPPPTTRLTRSAFKQLSAKNDAAATLHPGLTAAPRQRKRVEFSTITSVASPKPCLKDAQPPCEIPNRSGSSTTKLELLPATTYISPCMHPKPHFRAPSVIYAMSKTPDGQIICMPIRMGSAITKASTKKRTLSGTAIHSVQKEAANPGGPAPVAYMSPSPAPAPVQAPVPLTLAYNAQPARVHGSTEIQIPRRRRAHSHSSQISPCSGPAAASYAAVPPTSSRLEPAPPWAVPSGPFGPPLDGLNGPPEQVDVRTLFYPGWLYGFVDDGRFAKEMELEVVGDCKAASEDRSLPPAVMEATYEVGSVEEAEVLLDGEMRAQAWEQCAELPVVEIEVEQSPTDIFHEESYFSQMIEDSYCHDAEYAAAAAEIDAMDWSAESENLGTSGSSEQAPFESTPPPNEHIETPISSSSKKAKPDFSRSSYEASEPVREFAGPNTFAQRIASFCPSPANLRREKELRARLIASRKARRLMENILVRATDGTLSIASAQQTSSVPPCWSSQWQMDEDHYSVEEYDEDTVSY